MLTLQVSIFELVTGVTRTAKTSAAVTNELVSIRYTSYEVHSRIVYIFTSSNNNNNTSGSTKQSMLVIDNNEFMDNQDDNNVLRNGMLPSHGHREGIERAASREEEQEQFNRFVAALERLAPNGEVEGIDDWPKKMADQLGWDPDEVELYAFRYFKSLLEQNTNPAWDPIASSPTNHSGDPWSPDECLLFDTLVAFHRPPVSEQETATNRDWAWTEEVASHLPRRTADDVKRRYCQLVSKLSTCLKI